MTETSTAPIEITAFRWVPDFPRGYVRDLRVRWALEEMGEDYRTRLFHAAESPEPRLPKQPFGQVPAYADGEVELFETGAILLWLADKSETLMPRDTAGRSRTLCWAIAALNSVEPTMMNYGLATLFETDKPWAEERLPFVVDMLKARLKRLSDALGERTWIAECDRFTVADILMVSVLREARDPTLLEETPNLLAYRARGIARPAFQRALDAQCADFDPL